MDFQGLRAIRPVACHNAACSDTEIRPRTKIGYGVGTPVPGPSPDTSTIPTLPVWERPEMRTSALRVAPPWLGETKTPARGLRTGVPFCAHEGIRTPNLLIRSGLVSVGLYRDSVSDYVAEYQLQVRRPRATPIMPCGANRCRDVRPRTVPGLDRSVSPRIGPFGPKLQVRPHSVKEDALQELRSLAAVDAALADGC